MLANHKLIAIGVSGDGDTGAIDGQGKAHWDVGATPGTYELTCDERGACARTCQSLVGGERNRPGSPPATSSRHASCCASWAARRTSPARCIT